VCMFLCVSNCVWSRNLNNEVGLGPNRSVESQKKKVHRSQYPNDCNGDKFSCYILGYDTLQYSCEKSP